MISAGGSSKWTAVVALVVGAAAACSGSSELENGSAGEVDTVSEALGGTKPLVDVGLEVPMSLGTTYSVFRNRSASSCDTPDLIDTRTGARLSVPGSPACGTMTAATTFNDTVFFDDQKHGLFYRLARAPTPPATGGCPTLPPGGAGGAGSCTPSNTGGHGGVGPGELYWAPFATTNSPIITKMVSNGTYLFWYYGGRILHRTSLTTGETAAATLQFTGSLLAVEGNTIYVNVALSVTNYQLRSYTWTDNNPSQGAVLGTSTTSFDSWFSFDSSKFYWVANGDTSKILSLPKAGGSVSTVRSSTGFQYFAPLSNGSNFYWIDKNVSSGSTTIRRKNLSNGNVVATAFPFALTAQSSTPVNLLSNGIYFVPSPSLPEHWTLYRTDL